MAKAIIAVIVLLLAVNTNCDVQNFKEPSRFFNDVDEVLADTTAKLTWHSGGRSMSHSGMRDECKQKRKRLCYFKEVCPHGYMTGPPEGGTHGGRYNWAPILVTERNENWVQVGTGVTCMPRQNPHVKDRKNWYPCCALAPGEARPTPAPKPTATPVQPCPEGQVDYRGNDLSQAQNVADWVACATLCKKANRPLCTGWTWATKHFLLWGRNWCFLKYGNYVQYKFKGVAPNLISGSRACAAQPCPEKGADYPGNDLTRFPNVADWVACAARCKKTQGCTGWTYATKTFLHPQWCWLKQGNYLHQRNPVSTPSLISGSVTCLARPPPPVTCLHRGKLYNQGQEFTSNCALCRCGKSGRIERCIQFCRQSPGYCPAGKEMQTTYEEFETCTCANARCIDRIHPCDKANKGGCEHKCEKEGPIAVCSCNIGFQLARDRKHCKSGTPPGPKAIGAACIDKKKMELSCQEWANRNLCGGQNFWIRSRCNLSCGVCRRY